MTSPRTCLHGDRCCNGSSFSNALPPALSITVRYRYVCIYGGGVTWLLLITIMIIEVVYGCLIIGMTVSFFSLALSEPLTPYYTLHRGHPKEVFKQFSCLQITITNNKINI